ncbi:hypothetical protein AMECASPLE_021855 [Ameca splendens]|uniref:Uncharacterized protein n=1 Tax=Ameca splendens TaxID=208324 RepID=A0ABV0XGN5_9TELE
MPCRKRRVRGTRGAVTGRSRKGGEEIWSVTKRGIGDSMMSLSFTFSFITRYGQIEEMAICTSVGMYAEGKPFSGKCFTMPLKMVLLLLFLTLISDVCPMTPKEICVKVGDLVTIHCGCKFDGTVMLWKKETDQKMHLYSNMSGIEQQQLGLVVYQNSLVILSASVNHLGNYSCGPLRNTSCQMWFRLTVCREPSKEYKISNKYNQTCYTNQTCTLCCPAGNINAARIPNIRITKTIWHKENGELSKYYFPNVELEQSGVYHCTQSFLYSGQTYNASFTVVLDVQTGEPLPNIGIYSPKNGQVFEVELGTVVVITCTAVIDSCGSSLFWLRKNEFVENNDTLRYFYNYTYSCEETSHLMNASLVFREVLEEDLSTNFSCKLESDELALFVTITLNKTAGPSYLILTACAVCFMMMLALAVVTYVKFKIDVTLFLRDNVGFKCCPGNTSDEKSYDAFLMCYKSYTDGGLSEADRKCLATTLEDQFGYSLCLYDRDVLPGQAIAEAVLDCIEQSRAVVLIPSFSEPEPGSGVLSAIHASLVEQKTRLIFINTEQTEASRSGSFPEALQLLSKAGKSVTWKGGPPSSCFWKQLRYHLPAPQQAPKMQLFPQEC